MASKHAVAKTLEDAFNALDPQHAITPEQVSTLFVERPCAETEVMRVRLEAGQRATKLLFVGHRGAGKSSELTYLASLLKDKFLSVPIPLWGIYHSPSVSHAEVVLAMNLRLLRLATDEKVLPEGLINEAWRKYLKDRYHGLRKLVVGERSAGSKKPISDVSLKLNAYLVEVEGKIGTESSTRQKVGKRLQGQVSEMIQQIGDVARQLETKLKKGMLFLVEDLDKFDRKDTCDLFLEHAKTLTMPDVTIVYTFPVAMLYVNDFPEIQKSFDGTFFLPNISLRNRNRSPNNDGIASARNIITRRVEEKLFEPAALDEVVRLSGGHAKSLVQLAQDSVLNAMVAKVPTVSKGHVLAAAARFRDDYIRLLTPDQISLLRAIRREPQKDLAGVEQRIQELLYNGSLLEYGNTHGPWGDVNPIVTEILDRGDNPDAAG